MKRCLLLINKLFHAATKSCQNRKYHITPKMEVINITNRINLISMNKLRIKKFIIPIMIIQISEKFEEKLSTRF